MEGSFYFDDEGVVEILSAPAWSKAAIKQVQQALSEAQYRIADLGEDPELVIEETASRLEHANPAFASKFKEKLNSTTLNSIRDYVALLLMFATLIATISPGAPAWDEQLYEKVLELNVENELLKEKVDELLRDSSKSENIEEDPEN